ncbi:MAG: ThuA domain-containing protein [Verrucomicrobiales bacterium]
MSKSLSVTVWGENVHEHKHPIVKKLYPEGMHTTIADALREQVPGIQVRTATLQEPDHGLSDEVLANTDVLSWWGHAAHDQVSDVIVEKVAKRVWEGMGLMVLHSGHFSKIFRRLMGTPCALSWREAGEKERIWVCQPGHPIVEGVGSYFEIQEEEMYGEPFSIPDPDETLMISWFEGGEVFRSGCTWHRGAGKIFYFRPGHETYPTYHQEPVRKVMGNAVRWLAPSGAGWSSITSAPNVPVDKAPEKIEVRGESVH